MAIAHRSVEITLYYAIKITGRRTLFSLHGTANRGFIGLLTDSFGNAFTEKM